MELALHTITIKPYTLQAEKQYIKLNKKGKMHFSSTGGLAQAADSAKVKNGSKLEKFSLTLQ